MRRVLVTGATGGIGLTLVPVLIGSGAEVVATGRNAQAGRRLVEMGAAFRPADLVRDPLDGLLTGVDTVYHLAARSAPWGPAEAFAADNVEATRRLLEQARAAGVRRFVFASTPSIYAERRDRIGLTEESPVAARFSCAYARSKYEAERLVLAADGPEMRTIAIRPRAVAGPDDKVLLPRLARLAEKGRVPMPRGGTALIEITDVRDVAAAFLAAGRADAPGGVAVNISGGVPRRFRDLVADVCGAVALPFRPLDVPEALLDAVARLSEAVTKGREPAITRHGAMVVSWSQTFDLAGARRLLGWAPRFGPEEALVHALGRGRA